MGAGCVVCHRGNVGRAEQGAVRPGGRGNLPGDSVLERTSAAFIVGGFRDVCACIPGAIVLGRTCRFAIALISKNGLFVERGDGDLVVVWQCGVSAWGDVEGRAIEAEMLV